MAGLLLQRVDGEIHRARRVGPALHELQDLGVVAGEADAGEDRLGRCVERLADTYSGMTRPDVEDREPKAKVRPLMPSGKVLDGFSPVAALTMKKLLDFAQFFAADSRLARRSRGVADGFDDALHGGRDWFGHVGGSG